MKRKFFSVLLILVLACSFSLVTAVPAAGAAVPTLSGYEVITSPSMEYGDGGWGGWSVPEGKVVLGGGFYATAPVSASAPGTPNSVWPHYTYGANEYGWVVRDAPDGVPNTITIYAICADPPAGYEVVESSPLNYSDGGWGGWSVQNGKVVLGGGFVLSAPEATSAGAAAVSVPGTPGSVWPHYTYGDEYGWCVRAAVDGVSDPDSRIYVIYAGEPAGYGVVTSVSLEYGDGGWAGWSVPAGKVVLGGGFNLTGGPAAVSVPGTPDSVWPHYTYGPHEYGWVVRDAPDGASSYGSTVYAIYASLTEVWVDDGWVTLSPGDAADGHTFGYDAFATIQDGINAVTEGGTVNVAAGTYEEAVVIDKSLTLQGEDRETTELKFGYGAYPSKPPLIISADNVAVSGFTIHSGPYIEAAFEDSSGWAFTIIVDGDSALLTDLHVIKESLTYGDGNPRTGGSAFWLAPSLDGFTLTESTVDSAWNGIYAREDGSNITVLNVDFTYLGTYAIMLKQITGATIEGNTFTNTGNELGLLVSRGCEGIEIMDNKFTGSGSLESSHIGILLQDFKTGPVGVSILGNKISGFDRGIKVEANVETSGIHINYNSITGDTYSVENLALTTVDAENNWWGSAVESEIQAMVSGDVDFMPWYATETTTAEREYVTVKVGDTEEVRAYSDTIQGGINASVADDTINVVAGTYLRKIVINKALTVKSTDGAEDTIIQGVSPSDYYLVDIQHSDVTFDGFTVTNPTTAFGSDVSGILVQSRGELVSNVKILNNIVTQVRSETGTPSMYGATGINIGKGPLSDIVISGNTITDIKNPDGASVDHTCGINVWDGAEGVVIVNNTISDIKYNGIMLQWANNVQIAGNSITECETGIRVEPFEGATVSGYIRVNNIVGNEVGVQNWAVQILNAANNWWGSVNGPGQDEANGVLGDVDYSPWLPGEWETYYDLEAKELIDSDEDGFSDLEEYWLGTDPNNPDSYPGAAIDPGQVDNAYVEGNDPGEVNLQDSEGGTIADVDISGGGDASGTITGARYTEEPEEETSLSVGTGTTGVVFLDVRVTGYTEGIAHITVPYPDDPEDGFVDNTDPPVDETTLSLYYWDDAANMWLIADNNVVHTIDNTVSGDIPITALTGTPIGGGGYIVDEAIVAIESILNLSYSGEDTVKLTIDTNTAFLGAATIDLMFDPRVVEVLGVVAESSDFDTLTVNLNYAVIGSDTQIARFVAHQAGADGVDAIEGAVVAVVKLKAVGSTMDVSPLRLEVITLKDNKGDWIPYTFIWGSEAIVGGIGDANRDGVVDAMDLVYIECAIAGFPDYSIDVAIMDVSGDWMVDAWDCTYLARHLAGFLDYPLPPPPPTPAPPAP